MTIHTRKIKFQDPMHIVDPAICRQTGRSSPATVLTRYAVLLRRAAHSVDSVAVFVYIFFVTFFCCISLFTSF
jgi:hypothetical protein